MSALLTFPSTTSLDQYYNAMPAFMRPSTVPYAVSLEGALSIEECKAIEFELMKVRPHSVTGCDAITREVHANPVLNPIETIARNINDRYFGFKLDPGQHSWLQSYEVGGKYQRHMDGAPGQTRKLTAVALLSSPMGYEGGNLTLYSEPKQFRVPRTIGTVTVFQHWVEHDVSPVTSGRRKTINMGFWGPPFE